MSNEQEKKWREEIREMLEAKERQKEKDKKKNSGDALSRLEYLRREQIRKEEEEKFYKAKGYIRAKNKYGEAKWMSPEEAEKKKVSRKKRRRHSKKLSKKVPWLEMVLAGMLLFTVYAVYKYYKSKSARPISTGNIQISSNVPGAAVFLNGQYTNQTTPVRLENLTPGEYWILVEKPGFDEYPPFQIVQLEQQKSGTIDFTLSRSTRFSPLKIVGIHPPYDVYIDGFYYEMNEDEEIMCPEGWHLVAVSKQNRIISPYSQWIDIRHSQTNKIIFSQSNDQACVLSVQSNIFDAQIVVDGQLCGRTPGNQPLFLPKGSHEVQLVHPQMIFFPESKPVLLTYSKLTEITITGQKKATNSIIKNALHTFSPLCIDGKPFMNSTLKLTAGNHLFQLPGLNKKGSNKWMVVFRDSVRTLTYDDLQKKIYLEKY